MTLTGTSQALLPAAGQGAEAPGIWVCPVQLGSQHGAIEEGVLQHVPVAHNQDYLRLVSNPPGSKGTELGEFQHWNGLVAILNSSRLIISGSGCSGR